MNENLQDICYTLVDSSYYQKMTETNLKYCLECGNLEAKINALKEVIVSVANGERNDAYLILIIRFILPMQDHMIKKLLMIFWELYPKTGSDGELIKEMILVCDAFRKDLQHPNEYVRGSILRFLCKLKQPEILEPLIGSVRACLNHNRPYVRRNAVLAIYSIYKNYDYLIPDAPELIETFLSNEKDTSCKRNAFIMLLNTDIDKAMSYLILSLDYVSSFDHSLQIVIIELIQKICQKNSLEKSGFIRCIYSMLDSKNHAVRYEAARALIMLTNAPTAIKATITCYIDIVLKASDNTTKLIILDRLVNMKCHLPQKRILQECVPDILSLLPRNTDLKVKIKVVNLISDLITENNIEQIINILKKECTKDEISNEYNSYKIFLTQKLHVCYLKFPSAVNEIVNFLNDLLMLETDENMLLNILTLLREATHKFDKIRPIVNNKLKECLNTVSSLEVYCRALWIIVEFAENSDDIKNVLDEIHSTITEIIETDENKGELVISKYMGKTKDNIYSLNYEVEGVSHKLMTKPLINDIFNCTGFMASTIGWCVGKLVTKSICISHEQQLKNYINNKGMWIVSVLLNLNRTHKNRDSCDRLANCLAVICNPHKIIIENFFSESKKALVKMLSCQKLLNREDSETKVQVMQPDEPITMLQPIDQLFSDVDILDHFDKLDNNKCKQNYKLDKVLQLTGLSDPIYSETKLVHTSEQNIALHILLVNRTKETLQNCSIELASSGDLVITDKAQPKTIAPKGQAEVKVNVKVALTGNSIIFGNIVYDTTKTKEHTTIVLNDIPIDVIDYIKPSDCLQEDFRKMWLEFEWENKVYLSPKHIKSLTEFQNVVTKSLHMKCLTPIEAMTGECCFLTANLHAISIFGESVIANLSLEKNEETNKISGHIRLRAKSQGIVLGLGDIIIYLQC